MRNWKNWLLPLLTALTVGALALLPLHLSTLEDDRLTGTIHAEALTADNNFPSKPPELPGRIRLLTQYQSVPELLTIVGQEPEAAKLEELSNQAWAELARLVKLGILPEKSGVYNRGFRGSLLYLRDQRDLSSAAFAMLDTHNKETGETLSFYLDGESGQILTLELHSEYLLDFDTPAEDIGSAFFSALGLRYEPLDNIQSNHAAFRLADSDAVYWIIRYDNYLHITLEMDWRSLDDDPRTAMGYPPGSSVSVDAGPMQNW